MVRELTQDRMRHELARAATWYVVKKAKNETIQVEARPPMDVVRDVLATPNQPLPVLGRIIEAPVFAADGTLLATPGYHTKSQLFLSLKNLKVPTVPPEPALEDIEKAKP